MPFVWILQHMTCEGPGLVEEALFSRGVVTVPVRGHTGQPVPEKMGHASGLVLLGGPQSVLDLKRHPWMRSELRLVEDALKLDLPVLGICLGSHILASALGARITRAPQKEIGWHPVRLTEAGSADALLIDTPSPLTAWHWHGDVLDLPERATLLASSDLTRNQAFRHSDNAWGFQYHMEASAAGIWEMIGKFPADLEAAGIDPGGLLADMSDHLPALEAAGLSVFGRWVAMLDRHALVV